MAKSFKLGDCVKIPDGRIGRVREKPGGKYRVRVRRKTSETHQFMIFATGELKAAACPKGWMSPAGYVRYLRTALKKAKARKAGRKPGKRTSFDDG
jgi:hypothetical protein